jgi:hypothetical protein
MEGQIEVPFRMIGALERLKLALFPISDFVCLVDQSDFKRGISVEDARPFCNTFKGDSFLNKLLE